MKKILWVIVISIIAVCVGFFIGKDLFKPTNKKENNAFNHITNLVTVENINYAQKEEIQTSVVEEKICVNTVIKEITYYRQCNHQLENKMKNINKYVNMNKERFQKEFPNWEIKEFNRDNVVIYKAEDDFCNEHFLVKDEDGYVTIYTVNNEEKILELLDKTDISTKYLSKTDQDNLEKGMIIYTKQNLNKLIEDFE